MDINELERYLDALNFRPFNVTEVDINEFQRMLTDDVETYCSAIVKIDKWDRSSHGFTIATILHVKSMNDESSRFHLSKKYQKYFKRSSDQDDYMYKRISELGDLKDEKRD